MPSLKQPMRSKSQPSGGWDCFGLLSTSLVGGALTFDVDERAVHIFLLGSICLRSGDPQRHPLWPQRRQKQIRGKC